MNRWQFVKSSLVSIAVCLCLTNRWRDKKFYGFNSIINWLGTFDLSWELAQSDLFERETRRSTGIINRLKKFTSQCRSIFSEGKTEACLFFRNGERDASHRFSLTVILAIDLDLDARSEQSLVIRAVLHSSINLIASSKTTRSGLHSYSFP